MWKFAFKWNNNNGASFNNSRHNHCPFYRNTMHSRGIDTYTLLLAYKNKLRIPARPEQRMNYIFRTTANEIFINNIIFRILPQTINFLPISIQLTHKNSHRKHAKKNTHKKSSLLQKFKTLSWLKLEPSLGARGGSKQKDNSSGSRQLSLSYLGHERRRGWPRARPGAPATAALQQPSSRAEELLLQQSLSVWHTSTGSLLSRLRHAPGVVLLSLSLSLGG